MTFRRFILILLLLLLIWLGLRSCGNSPWQRGAAAENTYFTSYSAQIRSLDPTTATFQHELTIVCNVVETPLAYHYLIRPYKLIPQLLTQVPTPTYYDKSGQVLPADADSAQVARAEYILRVSPDIRYQPHPAFAPDSRPLTKQPTTPGEFGPAGTREVTAADLKTALVRLSDPRLASAGYSTFRGFIAGLDRCSQEVAAAVTALNNQRLAAGESEAELQRRPSVPNYADVPLEGCQVLDKYTLRITLTRKYPQFAYWLATPYMAPIPQEALDFYHRKEVHAAGLTWGGWPVGCGPYMLEVADTNTRVILRRNPNYRECRYPSEGAAEDAANGLLADAGKLLPFIDRVVFNYERESIPNWIQFQQGYYDNSGIPNDMFDSAVTMQPGSGELRLSDEMAKRGLKMVSTVPPISYYFAFNMRDPVVGGLTPQARALRQALSMVIDTNEYITIFKNGNGLAAEGIIPPGLFGEPAPPEFMNTVLHEWDDVEKKSHRKSLSTARQLMAEAGYPGGISPQTGAPLTIHLDHAAAGLPDFKNRFQWLAARFKLLGVELAERPTDLNRSREKLTTGNWQFLFERGWVADYPDPENFLFLFHSVNGHVATKGPNYSNYNSPEFDVVFRQLETMPNSPARLQLIHKAQAILSKDAPVIWDYHPINTTLIHRWLYNYKPIGIANDTIKYLRIDPAERVRAQRDWNRPITWPLMLVAAVLLLAALSFQPKAPTN